LRDAFSPGLDPGDRSNLIFFAANHEYDIINYMTDDNKLKVILYTIVVLTVIAIIGAWELFFQPIFLWVAPFVTDTWTSIIQTIAGEIK